MKEKLKDILKNKKLLMIIGIVILILIFLIFIIQRFSLTKLEKLKIKEVSTSIENYLDEVILYPDDDGRYINFAIEYLYNTTDKSEFSIDEVIDVVNNYFSLDYNEKIINEIGISNRMLDKGIVFDSSKKTFEYKDKNTRLDIANRPIVKYNLTKIKKLNKDKFRVTYEKYIVENPYDIFNYYNNNNINKNDIEEITKGDTDKKDLTDITEYLKGNQKIGVIKNLIDEDNIKNFGKIDGNVSILYVIKNKKLIIKKIG